MATIEDRPMDRNDLEDKDKRLIAIEKRCAALVCSGQPLTSEEAMELFNARAKSRFTYDPINDSLTIKES